MSNISEAINNLDSAIYDVLAAASDVTDIVGTNIVRGLAQMYSGHPLVRYVLVEGGSVNESPVEKLDLLYDIRGISDVSPAQAASIAGACHEALDRVELTVAGYKNILTRVEGFISWPEFRIQPAFETWHAGRYIRFVLAKT